MAEFVGLMLVRYGEALQLVSQEKVRVHICNVK